MSEAHDEHSSPIKTPKQLIITVIIGFAVPIAIAVLASQFATTGRTGADPTGEKTAALIQPVARVVLGAAGGGAKADRTGEQVYQAACLACHGSGAAGAPKVGDNAAWAPRLGGGLDGLSKTAIAGKGAMPPRGGNPDVSDIEIARAIVFMANQSGAKFKEPAAPAAAK
jgi:cytochrome c5